MGRFTTPLRAGAVALGLATAALGPGPAVATTTTTRPRPPGVFTPSVSPSSVANRPGCGPTTATVSTGTSRQVRRDTFRVQVAGRLTTLYPSRSGTQFAATLNGRAFS